MAYQAGDPILDDEYNTFATGNAAGTGDNGTANLNTLWGTGTGDYGYGETGSVIAAVSAGATITATQWETLVGRMETIAAHTASTVTAVDTITAGDTIDAVTTLQADIVTIWGNRYDAAASGTAITSGGTATRTASWSGDGGAQSVNVIHQVAFASTNAARYFFNAGGLIKLTFSRSGGQVHPKNAEWTDLCTKMGTIALSGNDSHTVASQAYTGTTQIGGSAGGAGSAKSTLNFHELTSSFQQMIIKYADSSPYSANYIKLEALQSGANVQIRTTFQDDAADTGNPSYPTDPDSDELDIVDGTLVVTLTVIRPSSTYLTSAAWGTPTISITDAL